MFTAGAGMLGCFAKGSVFPRIFGSAGLFRLPFLACLRVNAVNMFGHNSTVNDVLTRHCKACDIPVISIHGLRHIHV